MQADPPRLESVKQNIEQQIGAEIAEVVENFLVVVLETDDDRQMKERFDAIVNLPGVISANLAYYNTEDLAKNS